MSAHAFLSASGSGRWLRCTMSAHVEKAFPDGNSEHAAEGTRGHGVGEWCLQNQKGVDDWVAEIEQAHARGESPPAATGEPITPENFGDLYPTDLLAGVDAYVVYVALRFAEIKANDPEAVLLIEQRADFSTWVPEGFGTADCVIVSNGVLHVIDLKCGKGVVVHAARNSQLMLYALGMYAALSFIFDIAVVRMVVHQPRLDHVDEWECSVEELLAWAEGEVRPRALLAYGGEAAGATFEPSEEACRFCRARHQCRARTEANLAIAQLDFRDPHLLSVEEVSLVLERAEELCRWAGELKAWALEQATRGIEVPGWKLVEGRSNRYITNETAVRAALVQSGFSLDQITKSELRGLTELQALLKTKKFRDLVEPWLAKPRGRPVLVPADDGRPAISSAADAAADFSEQT